MKKEKKFSFRTDQGTLDMLSKLEQESGESKSVILRRLVRKEAQQADQEKYKLACLSTDTTSGGTKEQLS